MISKISGCYWWTLFLSFSTMLLAVYTTGVSNQGLQPFLEGLSALMHFGIHYVTAIFTALIVCIAYLIKAKQRALEPLVLLIAVFVSHYPDLRFAFTKQEHESWEVIFLGHTVVDDQFFPLFYILLPGIAVLIFWYAHLLKDYNKK